MPRFKDRTGQKFERLTVLERAGTSKNKKVLWRCICDCGTETVADSCSLVTSNTTSCGCLLKEKITKHGGWNKSSYNTWRAMIRRCTIPTDKDYPRYGGRGVSVCQQWFDYTVFVQDMGEPNGDETLDRINPYGHYTPENCRWAGLKTQSRNIRIRPDSTTGITGVSQTGSGKFMAKITVNKHSFYSKVYNSIEDAAKARKELELLHWGATT